MGIALSLAAATLCWYLARLPFNAHTQISALTFAIVAGMIFGNYGLNKQLAALQPGLKFSQQKLLRLGIVLYGLRLSIHDLISLGPVALFIDLVVIATILLAGYAFGTRVLKMDRDTTLLICAGSGICGAAAVLATDRVIDSEANKVSVAVGTVVIFGTLAMFLYPALYPLSGFGERQFGIYIGATVHEVAHVVAAGRAVSLATANTAVVTKMLRVLLLAPVLLLIGQWRQTKSKSSAAKASFPWFVAGFGATILVQPFVPPDLRALLLEIDTILLAAAMFALGTGTRWDQIKATGARPVLLSAALFATLLVEGYALTATLVR